MPQGAQQATLERVARLGEVLPSRGRVIILPHNYPDPDALASAAGMQLLLAKRFGLTPQIIFTGVVSRAENRELLRQFRYKWDESNRLSKPSHSIPTILVDTSPWSGNVSVPAYCQPAAVIDHHPLGKSTRAMKDLYVDIRTGSGATCTIVYQYLIACGIAVPKWLATIMTYAIASETLDLSRDSSEDDLLAYVQLLSKANLSNLGRIRHAPLPRIYYATLQEAMRNAKVFGRVAWTYLARVEQPEIVAEVADLLHRCERITWAFCMANMNGRLLVSMRSSDPGARCNRLLRHFIGKNGNAGGHHHMAAGFMNTAGQSPEERDANRDQLIQKLALQIERRYIRRTGANEAFEAQSLIEPGAKVQ